MLKAPTGPMALAFDSRVKWMHYWIRKGNPERAYRLARDLFHQVHAMDRFAARYSC